MVEVGLKMIKSFSEAISISSFIDRFEYLKIGGTIGKETFGSNRYLNQLLYNSSKWKELRREIIIRDMGNDLSFPDREINGRIIVHHINPITIDDIYNNRYCVFDPNNLICCSMLTHEAIHYGDVNLINGKELIERLPNDMIPWRV